MIKVMVLQGGIEPPTSSLPMKCSTTELLQRLNLERAGAIHRPPSSPVQAALNSVDL